MKFVKGVCLGFILSFIMIAHAGAESLLVANFSVSESSVSKGDVKRIFLGKKVKWSDGQKIHAVILTSGAVHEDFIKKYIAKTAYSLSLFWKMAIVTATGIPPKSFNNESDLLKYVAETKGAVGYISVGTANDGVKLISIK